MRFAVVGQITKKPGRLPRPGFFLDARAREALAAPALGNELVLQTSANEIVAIAGKHIQARTPDTHFDGMIILRAIGA
jgi:hypothetical protein